MKKSQLKQIIKECIDEVSSEEWVKVGQRPPKTVSALPVGKKTYDEPTFGDNQQLPHLTESDKNDTVDIGDGFYIHKTGLDLNGNYSVWVSRGANKPRKIQTNGNIPAVHLKDKLEIANDELAKQQIKNYYRKYLIKEQLKNIIKSSIEEDINPKVKAATVKTKDYLVRQRAEEKKDKADKLKILKKTAAVTTNQSSEQKKDNKENIEKANQSVKSVNSALEAAKKEKQAAQKLS